MQLLFFCVLLNFPRHNLMKGMGQIVTWSIRDETLRVEGMSQLLYCFRESRVGAMS